MSFKISNILNPVSESPRPNYSFPSPSHGSAGIEHRKDSPRSTEGGVIPAEDPIETHDAANTLATLFATGGGGPTPTSSGPAGGAGFTTSSSSFHATKKGPLQQQQPIPHHLQHQTQQLHFSPFQSSPPSMAPGMAYNSPPELLSPDLRLQERQTPAEEALSPSDIPQYDHHHHHDRHRVQKEISDSRQSQHSGSGAGEDSDRTESDRLPTDGESTESEEFPHIQKPVKGSVKTKGGSGTATQRHAQTPGYEQPSPALGVHARSSTTPSTTAAPTPKDTTSSAPAKKKSHVVKATIKKKPAVKQPKKKRKVEEEPDQDIAIVRPIPHPDPVIFVTAR